MKHRILYLIAALAALTSTPAANAENTVADWPCSDIVVTMDLPCVEQGVIVRHNNTIDPNVAPALVDYYGSNNKVVLSGNLGEGADGWFEISLADGSMFELRSITLYQLRVENRFASAFFEIKRETNSDPSPSTNTLYYLPDSAYQEELILDFPPGDYAPMSTLFVNHRSAAPDYVQFQMDDIVLEPVNCELVNPNPPVADAGPDQSAFVRPGQTSTGANVQGAASDPDGGSMVGWLWTLESAPEGSSAVLCEDSSSFQCRLPNGPKAYLLEADVTGDYVLSFEVLDGCRWSEPDFVTIHVVEVVPPEAIINTDVTAGPAPLTVHFDGSASTSDPNVQSYYEWDFGDDSPRVFEVSPTHVYGDIGTYTVTLGVSDSAEQLDVDTLEITVTAPNNPPEANPTATPNEGPAPLVVQFAANSSDPEADVLSHFWDFGDPDSSDNTSTAANPVHVYQSTGPYVVWLTVSDGTFEVTESATVVVTGNDLLSTRRAVVKRNWHRGHNKGAISYWADLDLSTPAPDDVISLSFDGIKFFNKPFGEFTPGFKPNVYVLTNRWLFVRIDFDRNRIYVVKSKVSLNKFDNYDGVDVEFDWGDQVAVDQFVMTPIGEGYWRYLRNIN